MASVNRLNAEIDEEAEIMKFSSQCREAGLREMRVHANERGFSKKCESRMDVAEAPFGNFTDDFIRGLCSGVDSRVVFGYFLFSQRPALLQFTEDALHLAE